MWRTLQRPYINRLIFISTLLIILTACEQSADKSDLIGIWVSDKEMTLGEMQFTSSEVDTKRYAALDGMLGKMAYIFRESATTFTPVDTIDQQEQWFNWQLIETNQRVFVVDVDVNGNNRRLEFFKKDSCIGLRVEVSNFIEYFCKKS